MNKNYKKRENNNTEFAIKNKPKKLLNLLKGFKFVVTLVLIKKTINKNKAKYSTCYSNSIIRKNYSRHQN